MQAAAAAVSESKFLRRETGLQARTRRIVARYDACLTRRHGKRYRHGLWASELCDLQWSQVELATGRLHVRRAKNGSPSVHPMQGDEIRALRRLQREQGLSSHVFMTERDGPMTPKAFHALFGRIGARAKMQFPIHPHMLRHGCGATGLARAQKHPAHGALHRAVAASVQGLLALIVGNRGMPCDDREPP